jgi:hypothetical protein
MIEMKPQALAWIQIAILCVIAGLLIGISAQQSKLIEAIPPTQMTDESYAQVYAPIVRPILPSTFQVEIINKQDIKSELNLPSVVDVRIIDTLQAIPVKSVTDSR